MKKATIISLLLCFCFAAFAQSNNAYIKKYTPITKELSASYEIPPSVILGIAIIESGLGKSKNCKQLKNHFGIIGKNKFKKEKGVKGKKSRFKQYDTDEDSYKDFCKVIAKKKFYKKLKGNSDWRLWLDAISKAGYAERPAEWKALMTQSIKSYKLYKLDKEMVEKEEIVK